MNTFVFVLKYDYLTFLKIHFNQYLLYRILPASAFQPIIFLFAKGEY